MTQAPAAAPGAAAPAPAPPAPAAGSARPWYRDPAWYQAYGVYVAVGALLLFNALFTERFLTTGNLTTQLVQVAPIVIVALGMALVIGTEGVDLSVGSAMALAAALLPLYLGYGLVPALVLALLAGAVTGLVNGVLVSVVGLQPIVATLALAVAFLVARTTFGRQIVAIGGNRKAAVLAGLPVKRVLTGVYVLCGTFAALAGILATARLTASDPSSLGTLMELSAITAVVVGGIPLSGGSVRVLGTVAGAVLMQLLRATLVKHDLPDSTAQIAQAAIIVAAVYVARERRSR
ncbi:ABC transporter permease [Streptomyces albidoflavus]|uniref:ABC transporter permease n=1 Tax=Streptomyces albidoflavus TaxID=1886 RepID=UPI0033CA10AA